MILLKGVHLRTLDEFFTKNEWDQFTCANIIIEKRGFVLSRKTDFDIFYPGPIEMHKIWLQHLRKCCILHKFQKNYQNLNPIGIGSKSIIQEERSLENGQTFAVKEYDKQQIKDGHAGDPRKDQMVFSTIENEINILRMIDNEYTMKLFEVYEDKRQIKLVLEKMNGGDLFKKLSDPKFKKYKENDFKFMIKQILLALKNLHEKGIMHRDIKPENILFVNETDLTLKLGDFGLAEFENKKSHLLARCGTPGYVAPEVLKDQEYDKKCDLFGVGVILYMM